MSGKSLISSTSVHMKTWNIYRLKTLDKNFKEKWGFQNWRAFMQSLNSDGEFDQSTDCIVKKCYITFEVTKTVKNLLQPTK